MIAVLESVYVTCCAYWWDGPCIPGIKSSCHRVWFSFVYALYVCDVCMLLMFLNVSTCTWGDTHVCGGIARDHWCMSLSIVLHFIVWIESLSFSLMFTNLTKLVGQNVSRTLLSPYSQNFWYYRWTPSWQSFCMCSGTPSQGCHACTASILESKSSIQLLGGNLLIIFFSVSASTYLGVCG